MKLQKLTIHNLASIEDAEIDFEAQPLASSEVFLITGKTGAGKSTLLDAICLALYADTPRLSNTNMQGNYKEGSREMKVKDPCQLMRRNTAEAYVTLTFIGNNEVHYEATWSVKRAYKKLTGNIQSKKWQLTNLDTDHTFTKDDDIREECIRAIGLDFKQFLRTTMLAQGEFTRFLNSKDDEKAEILEKITGVDIYTKIGARTFAITSQKEKAWNDATSRLEGISTLSDQEVAGRQLAMAELDKEYEEQRQLQTTASAKRDWLQQHADLTRRLHEAQQALQTASEAMEQPEYRERELLIADWHATLEARGWMAEAEKSAHMAKRQQGQMEALAKEFVTIQSALEVDERLVATIRDELNEAQTQLQAEADKAEVYANVQTLEAQLTLLHDGRKAMAQSQQTMSDCERSLTQQLAPALQQASIKTQTAREALEKAMAEVHAKEQAVTALHLPDLRTRRDQTRERLIQIRSAHDLTEALGKARTRYAETSQRLAQQHEAIEQRQKEASAMEAPLHDAELRMQVRKEDLERQRDTIHKFATSLRVKLKVGDVCPVCRQPITTQLPHEEELTALVSGLQLAYDEAEQQHRKLHEAKMALEAEIRTYSQAYEHDRQEHEADQSVQQASDKALQACKECGLEVNHDVALTQLTDLEATVAQTITALEQQIKAAEMQEQEMLQMRKAIDERHAALEQLLALRTAAEKAVHDCEGQLSTQRTLIDNKQREVQAASAKIHSLLAHLPWDLDWEQEPLAFAKRLTQAASRYNDLKQRIQTLTSQLNAAETNVANVRSVIESIINTIPDWDLLPIGEAKPLEGLPAHNSALAKPHEQLLAHNSAKPQEQLLARVNALSTAVTSALTQLETAEQTKRTHEALLQDFLSAHPDFDSKRLAQLHSYTLADVTRLADQQKQQRDEVIARKTLVESAQLHLNQHMDKNPTLSEDETQESLSQSIETLAQKLAALGERKGAIQQELKSDEQNRLQLGTLIAQAESLKADYQKWSRLNQLIGDATGKRFRTIAQSYVLSSLIHSANGYMQLLTDRYQLRVEPGTFIIMIEDAYQGYVTRATSTISGGESFLVSLSLALALSDIGQTLYVDTLFIDEGFGTLSGEPLQHAINTLRSLHKKAGRHVGIISHVEELKERIPVQIQVNQEGNHSSSKVRVVPEDII